MMRQDKRSGVILLLVLIILAILSAASTAVMHNSLMEIKIASNTACSTQAFYLAESGIEEAKQILRQNMPWYEKYTSIVSEGIYTPPPPADWPNYPYLIMKEDAGPKSVKKLLGDYEDAYYEVKI